MELVLGRRQFISAATAILMSQSVGGFGAIAASTSDRKRRLGTIQVGVDPRIELTSIAELLFGYPLVTKLEFAYKKEVEEHFGAFQSDPAVTLFLEMAEHGFSFDAIPDTIMRFTPPPALRRRISMSPDIAVRAGGEEKIEQLLADLRQFVQRSGFEGFYRRHQSFYGELASLALPSATQVFDLLQDYTGTPLQSAKLILGPLLHDGGFAAHYDFPNGVTQTYAFIGPNRTTNDMPDFGDAARINEWAGHEFSHSIVNPLTARHPAQVSAAEPHLLLIADAMKKNGYTGAKTTINEHIVRAIVARLIFQTQGERAAEDVLARERKRGFAYVPILVDRLKEYESRRRRYPAIADFYDELLKVFMTDPPATRTD